MKTELRPTPETDAAFRDGYTFCREDMRPAVEFCANFERERDEALALAKNYSERWTAECKTLRGQIEAMREAIKEVFNSFNDEPASDSAWLLDDRQTSALSKLQPFLP